MQSKNFNIELNILLKNKLKIIIFIIIAIMIALIIRINQGPVDTRLRAVSTIVPLNKSEMIIFNNYNNLLFGENNSTTNNQTYGLGPIFEYPIVTQKYLLNLFLDFIQNDEILNNEIKKSNLIDRDNLKIAENYKNALDQKLASIQIYRNKNSITSPRSWTIETLINDKLEWEKFLKKIEINANLNALNYFKKNLTDLISMEKYFSEKKTNEINFLLANKSLKNEETKILKNIKNNLQNDTIILKLENFLQKLENYRFKAAKILVYKTKYYKVDKELRLLPVLIKSAMIGLLIGIFYILILNHIQNGRN